MAMGGNSSPHSATIVFFLALCSCYSSLPSPFTELLLRAISMGKRGSTAAGTTAGAAAKKAKTVD
jgi:hypothetical protein